MKLRHQVFIYALLLLLFCDGLSAGISFWVSRSLITDNIMEAKQNELMTIDRRVRDAYRIASDKLDLLSEDVSLRELMRQVERQGNAFQQDALHTKIRNVLKLKLYNMREFQNIHVVVNGWIIAEGNHDQFVYARKIPEGSGSLTTAEQVKRMYPNPPLRDSQFVERAIEADTSMIGVLDFQEIVRNESSLFVTNQEAQTIYDQTHELNGHEIEVTYASAYSGLKYTYLLNPGDLNQKFAKPLRLILWIATLTFIGFSVVLYLLTGKLLQPISDFTGLLARVGEPAFQTKLVDYIHSQSTTSGIKTRLYRYFAICIIPLFLVIVLSFFIFRDVVLIESRLTNYGTVSELRSNIEYRMNSYLMMMRQLALDANIQGELVRIGRDGAEASGTAGYSSAMPGLILAQGILGQNIQYLRFYDNEGSLIYASDHNEPSLEDKDQWRRALQDPLTSYQWRMAEGRYMENRDLILVGKIKYLPRPEPIADVFEPIGYVEMSVKQFFLEHYEGSVNASQTAVMIMDHDKQLLFSSRIEEAVNDELRGLTAGIALYDEPGEVAEYASENRMLIAQPIPQTDWTIGYSVPLREVTEGSKRILLYNLYVVGAMLCIAVLISQVLARRIVRPINQLKRHMNTIEDSGAVPLAVSRTRNEFAALAQSFNRMLVRLKRLSEMVREKELEGFELEKRKKEAQLIALHAQMNPHFLNNIFTSIHMLVEGRQNDKASEMIQATGKLLRFGLTRGEPVIRVEEELRHVDAYIRVQQIRYKSRVKVCYDWPESIGQYRMLKFLIQPIVENVFEHASKKRNTLSLLIRLQIREQQDLIIEVADTGVGIEEDQLASLLQGLRHPEQSQGEHIGLINVHERIQLYYGSRYGITISSQVGAGTTVVLTLPVLKETIS